MDIHQEAPETRWERSLILVVALAILLAGDRLVARIFTDLKRPPTVEFVGLALLLGLAIYLGILFYHLLTVRYGIDEEALWLRRGMSQVRIDLREGIHLHRWRDRWGWSGETERDLGVEAIDLFPSLLLFRRGTVWVVASRGEGPVRAVALRPSPRLLALLRERSIRRMGSESAE